VRFLVDAQLPPALARFLADRGHLTEHVADVGLLNAPDRAIWARAVATAAVLVSKDEDFITLRALSREPGPPILWVRVGNTTNRVLLTLFEAALPAIVAALERGETVVEVSD
jgi:predicted nuclease of predicted toxin-antitoxin system